MDRNQVLAFRQQSSYLDKRLSKEKMVETAFAGLQDSSPRSAVLSLHARVHNVPLSAWEDSRFVQIWGPRGAVYVVPKKSVGVFTLGRLPRDPAGLALVENALKRVEKFSPDASSKLSPNSLADLRNASITGKILIRWDGSRISWWPVKSKTVDPEKARLELARRFLHCLGPSTPKGFAWWAGISPSDAKITFHSLARELCEVRLDHQPVWILNLDLPTLEEATPSPTVRLLPPGDPYLASDDRTLLVPNDKFRAELWPKSVWPGALFENGELTGTWRRQQGRVIIHPWKKPRPETVKAVQDEVESMPFESGREVAWQS